MEKALEATLITYAETGLTLRGRQTILGRNNQWIQRSRTMQVNNKSQAHLGDCISYIKVPQRDMFHKRSELFVIEVHNATPIAKGRHSVNHCSARVN